MTTTRATKVCPREPTAQELESPLFEAVWQAIKRWDLARNDGSEYGHLYSGATGTDVATILDAIAPFVAAPAAPSDLIRESPAMSNATQCTAHGPHPDPKAFCICPVAPKCPNCGAQAVYRKYAQELPIKACRKCGEEWEDYETFAAREKRAAPSDDALVGELAQARERKIVGWMVGDDPNSAAMYNAGERDKAFNAAYRWGRSITALITHPGSPSALAEQEGQMTDAMLEAKAARERRYDLRTPIIRAIYDVAQAIEACGASEKLTRAVTLCGELYEPVRVLLEERDASPSGRSSGRWRG